MSKSDERESVKPGAHLRAVGMEDSEAVGDRAEDGFETAVGQYRAQLRAGAELADSDLDEIEDHLRLLTEDLRSRGMPAAEAVTEAARRLGEPRKIAREHNRVRSAFGSRLSAARSWSVVALLVPMLALGVIQMYPYVGLWNRFMLECGFEVVLCIALVKRMGWARPLLLGAALLGMILSTTFALTFDDYSPVYVVWNLGMLAFLMPWRRNELTGQGIALAAYAWAYGVAAWALSYQVTGPEGVDMYFLPAGLIACVASGVATVGAMLRARWSSIAGAVTAAALGVSLFDVVGVEFLFDHALVVEVAMIGSLVTGIAAALAGSLLAWRGARSALGSLRAIRS